MALTSPGVQVTVIDESQYLPSAVNTVPYFVIATAQNKVSGDGVTVAAGTLAANANKTYLITSQRDLVATFGVPFFYQTTTGTPINGYELNEYGLLAAYSALGVSNRCYVQRADVDLTELTASLTRPTGDPANGTYWLDLTTSVWGIQEWNQTTATFTVKTPTVITDPNAVADAGGGDFTPDQGLGAIGDYAITAILNADNGGTHNAMYGYFKRGGPTSAQTTATALSNLYNTWVQVGNDDWKTAWPTVSGTNSASTLTNGYGLYINDTLVSVGDGSTANTLTGLMTAINNAAITGVYAAVISNRLYLYADSTAANDGSTGSGGIITIDPGPTGGSALLTTLGLTRGEYLTPNYFPGYSYQAPRWRTTDTAPHPTGSVWQNMSPVNNGLSVKVKKYSSTLGTWVPQTTPAYYSDSSAIYGEDPSGGGKNIPAGSTYLEWMADNAGSTYPLLALAIEERISVGQTIVTGTESFTSTDTPFTVGNTFGLTASQPGTSALSTTALVTIGGTGTVSDFISAVSAANIPNVTATVNSAGNIVFTHVTGGTILLLTNGYTGTPTVTAGFTSTTPKVKLGKSVPNSYILSNWVSYPLFTLNASETTPDTNPTNGRLWYYSAVDQVDIMIQNNGDWYGYQNVTNDVRGYDLSLTNATGPIISATAPTTQTDVAASPLVYGDLWISTANLDEYPTIYRWESVDGSDQWVSVDTTDQVTQNGILFADARWATNGTTDPVADPLPTITDLLTSNYLDPDAPNSTLYPQGMLMWNMRRSGYNVKSFNTNYFVTDSPNYAIDAWAQDTTYAYNTFVVYNGSIYVALSAVPANVDPTDSAYWAEIVTSAWVTASGLKQDGSMFAGRLAQRQVVVEALKSGIDTSSAAREEQNQFNIIATPAYPEVTPNMIALSNERNNTLFVVGDTPMRLAIDGNSLVEWATNNNGLGVPAGDGNSVTSNYCGVFYPSCLTNDLSGNAVVQPPSHMMVRTILRSDAASYPWFAPAGTRRGVVDNATAIGYINSQTGEFQQVAVGQAVRDILYERNINPITFIPGIGITNFGNKTSRTVTTALDRINVARLVAFLRGRLEEIGKLFLFEPNDQITRNQIANLTNSLMIDLVAKRAIYDYLVVCDLSNNTPFRIDNSELWLDVAIEPVKAVEFIYIPLRIKNTGAIAAGA